MAAVLRGMGSPVSAPPLRELPTIADAGASSMQAVQIAGSRGTAAEARGLNFVETPRTRRQELHYG